MIVSTHAVQRYQQRIENVSTVEVCRRLRERKGPPVRLVMRGDTVISVYPVNDANVTRSLKNGAWKLIP
jgi:hypothetical protein